MVRFWEEMKYLDVESGRNGEGCFFGCRKSQALLGSGVPDTAIDPNLLKNDGGADALGRPLGRPSPIAEPPRSTFPAFSIPEPGRPFPPLSSISLAQLTANRANSQLSTGQKTETGRDRRYKYFLKSDKCCDRKRSRNFVRSRVGYLIALTSSFTPCILSIPR
jgi:hypothetical protein